MPVTSAAVRTPAPSRLPRSAGLTAEAPPPDPGTPVLSPLPRARRLRPRAVTALAGQDGVPTRVSPSLGGGGGAGRVAQRSSLSGSPMTRRLRRPRRSWGVALRGGPSLSSDGLVAESALPLPLAPPTPDAGPRRPPLGGPHGTHAGGPPSPDEPQRPAFPLTAPLSLAWEPESTWGHVLSSPKAPRAGGKRLPARPRKQLRAPARRRPVRTRLRGWRGPRWGRVSAFSRADNFCFIEHIKISARR